MPNLHRSRDTAPCLSPTMTQRSLPRVMQRPSRSDLRYHARVAIDTLLVQSEQLEQDLDSLQIRGLVRENIATIHRAAQGLLKLTQPSQGDPSQRQPNGQGKILDFHLDDQGITDLSQPPSKRLVHLILHTCRGLLQDFSGQHFTHQVQILNLAAQQLQMMLDLLGQVPAHPSPWVAPLPLGSPPPHQPEPHPGILGSGPKTTPLTIVPTPSLHTPDSRSSPSPGTFLPEDLPLKPPVLPPLQVVSTPEPAPPIAAPAVQGASILVVDDSRTNREVLSQYLTQEGYQVYTAINGQQALELADADRHDLILLDVVMPKPDGYEVLSHLKSHATLRHIPVIMISALDQLDSVVKGIEMGAEDYLPKPFNPVLLRARIGACLEKKHLRDQEMHYVTELKRTQTKLIQSEKMSSLGQMVAGLAHEVNNPINFIYGNLKPAQEYIQDLLTIIHSYQTSYPTPKAELQDLLEDLEIDFIEEDIFKIMKSMRVGAERIRDLVLSLRNFSRLDEAEMKPAHLEEGIDSTLLILRHQLGEQNDYLPIEVIKDYGQVPETMCYPSQLNQVFMNILNNAIDAVRENGAVTNPQIHIKTLLHGDDKIRVKITDNGCGVADGIKSQIFDPFFTTKPVGSGQGLGLSICYQIVVDKHQGRLWCRSKPGQGSEFTIEIPYCSPGQEEYPH